jgi:hypothetical protein
MKKKKKESLKEMTQKLRETKQRRTIEYYDSMAGKESKKTKRSNTQWSFIWSWTYECLYGQMAFGFC